VYLQSSLTSPVESLYPSYTSISLPVHTATCQKRAVGGAVELTRAALVVADRTRPPLATPLWPLCWRLVSAAPAESLSGPTEAAVRVAPFRLVNPEPLPLMLPAEMAPAEKLPEASLFTIVFAVFALVAALAAVVPEETVAADTPPTLETTVALCVPVTSPDKEPEKLLAVVAELAAVAVEALPLMSIPAVPALRLAGFRSVKPTPFPAKVLAGLVRIVGDKKI